MRRTDPASTCPLHRSKTEGVVSLAKRPWTEEDNARLKEFVAQGASIIRAAAALHRVGDLLDRTLGSHRPRTGHALNRVPSGAWTSCRTLGIPRRHVRGPTSSFCA